MSNYSAIVSRVEEINPIPGADRIVLLSVAGENVIAQKGIWEVGDVGVFFPTNILLSSQFMIKNNLYRKHPDTGEPMGGYMEPDRRVRFIKMKGAGSRGLFLPISCFDYLKPYDEKFVVGFEFDTLTTPFGKEIICEKYTTSAETAQNKNQKVGKAKSKRYKNFYEIGDTAKLTQNINRFKNNDVWIVTEKLHGTSARTGFLELEQKKNWLDKLLSKFGFERAKKFDHISGTRRTVIGENSAAIVTKEDYRHFFHKQFKDILSPGMIVYYEIVGPGIMPKHDIQAKSDIQKKYPGNVISYNYGLKQGDYEAYVYKIVDHTADGRVIVYTWDQLVEWCEKFEVRYVPVIEKLVYDPAFQKPIMEMMFSYADGSSMLDNSHPREGVVVKTNKGDFKLKGDTFCTLEEIMLNSNQYIDPEDTV